MATGLFNLKQVNQAISQGAWSGYIAPKWVEYLVVSGGAGGGGKAGGGGGAGGLLTGIVTVTAGTSYTVTVGSGGAGGGSTSTVGSSGLNSVFGSITSTGGGGGGGSFIGSAGVYAGASGGSGGGAGLMNPGAPFGGSGVSGQGNSGGNTTTSYGGGADYSCSGGGGAGTVGLNGLGAVGTGPNGGAGIASAISGTVITYAGGGGGFGSNTGGTGGVGGGGNGGINTTGGGAATAGSTNTGGGGGGAGQGTGYTTGGTGGSGIVVVRYPGNVVFFTGGTVNYNNGYIIHIFTASGTLAPTTPTVYNTSYQISRSLRFNSADSAYLNRTPASTTNQRTWTFSAWIKRSKLSTNQRIFQAREGTTGNQFFLRFSSDNTIYITGSSGAFELQTTQLFRDPSAWYHIVFACDTTQATSSNRFKLYINGSQVTAFGTATYPSQNLDTTVNSTWPHGLGAENSGPSEFYDGYMTETYLIDGQALTPSSFGATSTTTGVWSPIQYTGTYGTNGFYLNFSDNSNTTAATLGKDYSGNGNNWTPNNFSVTAGASNDSLIDNPTAYGFDTGVGGTVRGNYCTLNPLFVPLAGVNYFALSNGNLDITGTGTANSGDSIGTISTGIFGKYYFEVNITSIDATGYGIVGASDINQTVSATTYNYLGFLTKSYGYRSSGTKDNNNTNIAYGSSYTTGDVIGVAIDCDNGAIYFSKNNTWQNSGVPTSGSSRTGAAFTWTGGSQDMVPQMAVYKTGTTLSDNFGQRVFSYTAPSGFKALCTQNLPTPTIGATSATLASSFFAPVLYTGTGATLSVTGVGFQPDWVWIKSRSAATDHALYDAVRGVQKQLESNTTTAETTETTGLTAFGSDGFTTGALAQMNTSAATYVAWNWKAGNNAGASNSAGSITSTVSANTTSGFSIVTYTGTGANATVGHGLGVAPAMVFYKRRSTGSTWIVYHASISPTNLLVLNESTAQQNIPAYFNSLATTSSVLNIGSNSDMNASAGTYVAYCFAPIAGYSAFGSYTGNGSTDGPFVFTGFRPAFIITKRTDSTSDWQLMDTSRSTYNVASTALFPNTTDADTSGYSKDFLSNGFKIRDSGASLNASGGTYIYMAFASAPFKFSLAR